MIHPDVMPAAVTRRLLATLLLVATIAAAASGQDRSRFPDLTRAQKSVLDSAGRLATDGKPARARQLLEKSLAETPHPALWFRLAELRIHANDPGGAATAFEKVLETVPDHAVTLRNLAVALVAEERWADAARPLTRALVLGGLPPERLRTLAYIHLEHRHDTAAAAEVFRRGILLAPDDVQFREGLVVALLRAGDTGAAVRAAEQALQVFPLHPRLSRLLASALIAERRYGPAADWLESLRLVGRARPADLRTLADLYYRDDLVAEAARAYADAEAAGVNDRETRLRHAICLLRRADPQAALGRLVILVKQHPDCGPAWLALGRTRKALGQANAVDAFERAAGFPATRGEARLETGILHLAAKRDHEAEAAFLDAASVSATAARGWKGLGTVAARRGQAQVAIRNYQRALSLDPSDLEVRRALRGLRSR